MNKITCCLSIFIGGATALVGFVSGYFTAKKQLEDRYEALYISKLDEELKKIREARTRELEQKNHGQKGEPKPTSKPVAGGLPVDEKLDIQQSFAPVVDYTKFSKAKVVDEKTNEVEMLEGEEQVEEDPEVAAVNVPMTEEDIMLNDYHNSPPEIVSLRDYKNLPSEFDFVTWHYFEGDGVVIDETDVIVDDEDVKRMLGLEALECFGERALTEFETEDPDCVYVVCGHAMLAIEIVRLHRDYETWSGKWSDI